GSKCGVRQYDPDTGRFLSPDAYKGSLANPASQNPYMYCRGNPIKYSDPSGYKIEITGDKVSICKAIQKLINSDVGIDLLRRAINWEYTVTITTNNTIKKKGTAGPTEGGNYSIELNLDLIEKKKSSAAATLGHELDHFWQYILQINQEHTKEADDANEKQAYGKENMIREELGLPSYQDEAKFNHYGPSMYIHYVESRDKSKI
ncbi:MAG: RHS repeat domain-containing protein, partial [Vulcanimicrobiota bacterium]